MDAVQDGHDADELDQWLLTQSAALVADLTTTLAVESGLQAVLTTPTIIPIGDSNA
jgi:hypothetical protein